MLPMCFVAYRRLERVSHAWLRERRGWVGNEFGGDDSYGGYIKD